jgi:hypothetical protein
MSKFVFTEPGAGKLEIEVSDPFTICEAPPGEYRIHPKPFILNDGRLIMTVNRDPDIYDAEYCVLASGDRGITWMPENRWPGGDGSGRHLATAHALLPDGTSLVVYPHMFATETPGSSIMPTWRSGDSGKTWSAMEAATVETPYSESIDIYDPPEWYREAHTEEWRKRFIKPEPPRLCAPLFSSFGRKKLLSYLTNFHSLDDGTLLAFIYLITVPFQPYITICIESRDAGRTWTTRSTPGPFRPEYEETNRRKKPVDGLCEPAATHLPGGTTVPAPGPRHAKYRFLGSFLPSSLCRAVSLRWHPGGRITPFPSALTEVRAGHGRFASAIRQIRTILRRATTAWSRSTQGASSTSQIPATDGPIRAWMSTIASRDFL